MQVTIVVSFIELKLLVVSNLIPELFAKPPVLFSLDFERRFHWRKDLLV
jgi:hypothetical protein